MTTVVLLHGLWLSHRSWQPWVDRFETEGYDVLAPAWPGEPDSVATARERPEAQAGVGIDQLVGHFAGLELGPLLMVAGGADHTVPRVTAEKAFALYRDSPAVSDLHVLDGKGHSLTIDHGWGEVFDDVLAWLTTQMKTGRALRP